MVENCHHSLPGSSPDRIDIVALFCQQLTTRGRIYLFAIIRQDNREFGQKIRFDFEMSVFTFVGFCNSEYKSSFLLRFISVAQVYCVHWNTMRV